MNSLLLNLLLILLIPTVANALSLNLCSNTNLGGDKTSSQFMSNGLCRDTCSDGGYAVAVLSGYDCYCTNNVPADTVDMSNCEVGCPGYKDQENCAGDGSYGYLVITNPSATVGASPSSSSTRTTGTTSSSSSSSRSSSTSSSSTSTTTSSSSTSSTSTSTTSSTSSTPSSTSSSPPPDPSTTSSSSSSTSTTSSSSSSSSSTSSSSTRTSTPTTLVTRTTEITQTHLSNNIVKITEYYTATITPSPPSTSESPSSSSETEEEEELSSESPLISTKIEPSTIYSILTINGTQTQEIRTVFVTRTPTQVDDSTASETDSTTRHRSQDASTVPTDSSTNANMSGDPQSSNSADGGDGKDQNKSSFFDDTSKVAGTFSAVGIVVVGIVCGVLYCCCCFGGGRKGKNDDHDGFTDEENQYSSDELSINHEKVVLPRSKQSSFSSLNRNNSGKSLFAYFTGDKKSDDGVTRSSSRKKLMSRRNSTINGHNGPAGAQSTDGDGGIMFPINELDSRLDPDTMFLNHNFSNKSFGDDHDYSRKLKVTNPE